MSGFSELMHLSTASGWRFSRTFLSKDSEDFGQRLSRTLKLSLCRSVLAVGCVTNFAH